MPRKADYWKNPEKYRAYNRAYLKKWRRLNPESPDKVIARQKKYLENPINVVKAKARVKLNGALRRGKITKELCEVKGCQMVGEGHHDDYSKPLDVRWLCRNHHQLHHRLTKGDKR